MKRYLPILLIVCLLLCACSQKAPDQTTTAPATSGTSGNVSGEQTDAPDTTDVTAEPTVPETVAVIRYRNPLTGTPIDSPWTTRPFAVMINNIVYAQPMCSLSNVDMLFEVLAEGGITRCLAVFSDVGEVDHIGSIRSARPYFADIAESFDAIYAHHGGTDDGYAMISALDVDDIDANDNAYYRDQDRLNAGYDYEHTSFTDGKYLIQTAASLSYTTTCEGSIDYGFLFDDNGSTGSGTDASQITVTFGGYGKTTTLNYNADAGAYTAYQYDADVIDGNTNEVAYFRNILVLAAKTSSYAYGSKTVLDITLTGEGEGYFACDGKIVPITWSREDQHSPFVFTHEDGTPITFGVGSSYIAVIPASSSVDAQ